MVYKKGYKRTKESIDKQKLAWQKRRENKIKSSNDKTNPTGSIMPVTSPQGVVNPEAGLESKSSILTEININGEFDKMATKLNKKEDKKNEKDYKWECGECGYQFNHKAEGNVCPGCGVELE